MRFLSLFAGIGGFDLGLERAGWECVGQVECDPYCCTVLERHWPDVWRRRDVRLCSADVVRAAIGEPDAIVGGFPCQPVSVAGERRAQADPRWLWPEFARLVRELRPRWVIAENVPGLRTHGADLVCDDLEAAGYTVWPLVVGARHVGAPHRRDRVWIIARLADADEPGRGAERGGRLLDGERATQRNDAHRCDRWPARPGEPPHAWEPPRITQSGLGRGATGISARLVNARWRNALKGLGNAAMPAVVEEIGHAINAVERQTAA